MTSSQGRLALAGALATLLATITLSPLLQGGGWFLAVFVVTAVVVGVGAAARQVLRWWPLVVLAQFVALALCLTWLFARDAAVFGLLPGPDVVSEMRGLVDAGLVVTRKEVPPIPAIRGVILVVCGGIGLVALVVDMIAASLRRPAVAGLPLLAVYCVPAAVLPGGLSWWYFVPAALGFLLLVGSDSSDRIRGWGRVLGPSGDTRGDRALGGPLAGARRLAVGSVVLAALVPMFVPGLGEQLLGNNSNGRGQGNGGSITVINPILNLRDKLNARSDTKVINYATSAQVPEPLRIAADEIFDGKQWSPSTGKVPRDNKVQNGLPSPPPGLAEETPRESLVTTIRTFDLRETYLPLPYPASKVDVEGPWLYDARSLNVVGDGVNTQNLTYRVEHLAVRPTPEQLESAVAPPFDVINTFTALPSTTPSVIRTTAATVTAGAITPYDQAMRLQQWLRQDGGFVYSTSVDVPGQKEPSGSDAVAWFLQTKHGYCVQFASAMAVMARALSIPSRVAVGFLVTNRQANGSYDVSVKDAHAWPELYFGGVGWVRFEPTPSIRTGQPPAWARAATAEAPAATSTVTQTAAPSVSASAQPRRDRPENAASDQEQPLLDRILAAVPWRWLAGLAGLLLLGGVPLVVELLVRRSRWRRAARGTAVARVEAAWDELRERLGDLGVTWATSWTPRALQLRLVSDHGLPGSAQAALARLVDDLEHVRYAPPDGAGREVPALRSDVVLVVEAVAASAKVAPWVRRRARWLPASGLRVLSGAVRRVDVAADQAGRRVSELGADVRRRVSHH